MAPKKRSFLTHQLPLILILLLAFGLRVHLLEERNIWWDEGWSNWLIRFSADEIIDRTAADVHPPLYYLLLHGWWQIVGEGEFLLRFPSALFGVMAVAVMYRAGRELDGDAVGLAVALVLAISRIHINMAQDMRMHSLSLLFVTLAFWGAIGVWKRIEADKPRVVMAFAGLYVLGMVGSLYSFYLTVSALLSINVAFLAAWMWSRVKQRFFWVWSAMQAGVLALFLPWYFFATGNDSPPLGVQAATDLDFLSYFYLQTLMVGIPTNPYDHQRWVAGISVVLLVGIGWLAWRKRHNVAVRSQLGLLLAGMIGCWLAVIWITHPDNPVARPLAPRYYAHLSTPYYLLAGWAMVALWRWRKPLGLLALALIVTASSLGVRDFFQDRARTDDFLSIAQTLDAYRGENDAVVLHTDRDWPVFSAHYDDEFDGIWHQTPINDFEAENVLAPLWEKSEAVWLVQTLDAVNIDPQNIIGRWLGERAMTSHRWTLGENSLTVFAKTEAREMMLFDLNADFDIPDISSNADEIGLVGAWLPANRYAIGDTAHLWLYWSQRPPQDMQFVLRGEADYPLDFTIAATTGAEMALQQVNFRLSPEVPKGPFPIVLQYAGQEVTIGDFQVIEYSFRAGVFVSAEDVAQNLDVRFGEHIRLRNFELATDDIRAGDVLTVTLFWQTDAPLDRRYKIAVQVLGERWNNARGNPLWGQHDSEPADWQLPTTAWQPDEIIADRHTFEIDAGLPPGEYDLLVVVYNAVTAERLPVWVDGESQADDVLRLHTLAAR